MVFLGCDDEAKNLLGKGVIRTSKGCRMILLPNHWRMLGGKNKLPQELLNNKLFNKVMKAAYKVAFFIL